MADIEELIDLMRSRRTAVLAGAGCSTESGIPDYRGPDSTQRRRAPIQYQEFMRSNTARARYWARSAVGWPRMANAKPNPTHTALAELEHAGRVTGIITQNVDGLHHAAGSSNVIELHGSLAWVCCTACTARTPRAQYQDELRNANPDWATAVDSRAIAAPDGDADLPDELVRGFRVPACTSCGGVIKPDVVFFGENVPRSRVDCAWELLASADALLVAGSSLTVYSGRRFVYRAIEHRQPVAVLNLGATRADDIATMKIDARLGEVMPRIAAALAA